MNLFELNKSMMKKDAPLAMRMRPKNLDEFCGQKHIVGENKLLYRAIKADNISSLVLFGPPGTGKTSLAKIISNSTKSIFTQLNATTAGVKDIKEVVEEAKYNYGISLKRTILFIDEIHRFNKSQQDALLPYVEDGTVILIGATTENPYFEVNKALLSRSLIFELKPIEKDEIKVLLVRALTDKENGLGALNLTFDDEAIDFLADISGGDCRIALNALELAAFTTNPLPTGEIHINVSVIEDCVQKRNINYEKSGDNHYDVISAFIKSMRGTDPDATLYYLARMLYAGESIDFIARRIVICASEDVGNADPHALMVATSAATAVKMIGMPEARIILAQAAVYIACAPKSNACYLGIDKALEDVSKINIKTIPPYLKEAGYSGAKQLERGIGYKYPHNFEGNFVKQKYLPDELATKVYYDPSENGVEKKIRENLRFTRG